jgi:peptide/nickel transport system substrate-binding protein
LSNHPNERITAARNPDYWKPGRPYLDGIEYTIIKDVSTRLPAFIAGQHDVYFGVTGPQLKDVKAQAPEAICEVNIPNVPRNMLVNPKVAPFDNPELRRAMPLSLDREAFNDIINEGKRKIGGAMQPTLGMPPEMLATLPGYIPTWPKTAPRLANSWKSSATGSPRTSP